MTGVPRSCEERRFFVIEGDGIPRQTLGEWMQEVERQIADLRDRLNDLPTHATRPPIRW